MGLRVVTSKQFVATESDGVAAANQRHVVCKFPAPQDCQIGKKNIGAQIVYEPGNLQTHLPRLIGDYVEMIVVKLNPQLVLISGAENVVPRSLNIVVIVVDGTAG